MSQSDSAHDPKQYPPPEGLIHVDPGDPGHPRPVVGSALMERPVKGVQRPGVVVLAACILAGAAGSARAESRGELLYSTHCIACHTTQVHWRDKKLATDWNSLKVQVRRWQAVAALGWSEEDVLDVTRHLNERFYGFTPTSNSLGVLVPAVGDGRERIGSN
jgi:mono/diheme cytochrome c family protein